MTVDAREERFELVEVLGHPMLFTCLRVDRSTVPNGLYLYEVRNDDDQCGLPVEIGRWVMVNHWGTLLSTVPIALEPSPHINKCSAALCLEEIGTISTRQLRERKCLKYLISVSFPSQII